MIITIIKLILENDEKISYGYALKFKAAYHENFVYKYKVVLKQVEDNKTNNNKIKKKIII